MPVTTQSDINDPLQRAYGATTAQTLRVVLASDSPGTSGGGAFDSNITQIKGVAVSTGAGSTDTGTLRVCLSSESAVTLQTDQVNLNTDQLESLATAGNVSTAAINAKITACNTGATVISAALPAGSNVIGHVIVDSGAITPTLVDLRSTPGTITVQDTGSSTATGFDNASVITGTPTAASFQTFAVNGYCTFRVQVSGIWTGTLTFETSCDGGTTFGVTSPLVTGTSFRSSTTTGNGIFLGDCSGATHVRVRATAAITGTATITPVFSETGGIVKVDNPVSLVDNTTGNAPTIKSASTNASATDTSLVVAISPNNNGQKTMTNSIPVVIASDQASLTVLTASAKVEDAASVSGDTGTLQLCVRNDTGASLTSTDLDYGAPTVDAAGRSIVTLGTLISGEDQTNGVMKVEGQFTYQNITTNTTTTVKSGAGLLHSITINTKGASSNVLTIFDNTAASGTKIGTVDTNTSLVTFMYDVKFTTGLTILTATGTAADVTVSYR
jgi:hypothetical protein